MNTQTSAHTHVRTRAYTLRVPACPFAHSLNEDELIQEIVESVPAADVQLIALSLPLVYLQRMLAFLGSRFETTRHIGELRILLHLPVRPLIPPAYAAQNHPLIPGY